MIRGFGASWKADIYSQIAAQMDFNNNYDQQSNIKGIGNSIHDIWHLAQTTHFSILFILLLLLFSCFAQLLQICDTCFPPKPIGVCFLHHWPGLSYFKSFGF